MNDRLYKEELLWQLFCRWLDLAPSDDIDDIENVDTLYNEFLQGLEH